LAILMLSLVVNAQENVAPSLIVPRLVSFSGKAMDSQGKPISGIAGVTFAIYKDQSEGAPLWMETQNVTTDSKGTYTAQLGATKVQGLPLGLFSSGEARWLGVRINEADEQPRVLLLSVPYALKAADAETIGGLPPSAFVLANGVKETGPRPTGTVATSTVPAKDPVPAVNPAVTGKGVLNFIPMWNTTSDIVDSLIFQKSSFVGIGTTAPAATLDVKGKGDIRDTLTLFPKATDPTLAINGTAFKVDSTGKVTFVSGQKFAGAGTVTSVALSAPASDFTVTGTPITKSGTLGLNWTVAPTSASTANAIVKRDASGSISAGGISASLGVTSLSSGIAVYGETSGSGGGADGVHGVAHGNGSGVAGITDSASGTGVYGQGPGYAMYANGNTFQARNAGGWVKAMVFASGFSGGIATCFNSTLSGAAATTPPCGFGMDVTGKGDYIIDFGFEVDDRFLSATVADTSITSGVCTSFIGVACNHSLSANQVEVTFYAPTITDYYDAKFYLIVY
jgi:hypothetical protein